MSFTVYKSSAGSGKTFTLVKEYLKLALGSDRSDYYRCILAITFTNKAAGEMKERVLTMLEAISENRMNESQEHMLKILSEELSEPSSKLAARADLVLKSILHNYSDFHVTTIDKFVHRIIKSFAFDLRIPMNFEVELDGGNLMADAVDVLLSRAGTDDELTKVLVEFCESRADDEGNWNIETDIRKYASKLLEEEGHGYIEKLKDLGFDEFNQVRKYLDEKISKFEKEISAIGTKALKLVEDHNIPPSAFAGGANGICKYFEYLADLRNEKFTPSSTVSKNMEQDKWFSTSCKPGDKQSIESIKDQISEYYNKALNYIEEHGPGYALYQILQSRIYSISLLNEIEKVLAEFRSNENRIHISEFNKRISEVVSREPAPYIYERVGERFRHYLIDEFQDTSELQWLNLLPLIENSLGSGNFNMLVGDGKQAIYRFRGGDVEQFADLPLIRKSDEDEILKEREDTLRRNFKGEVLDRNFRSRREIIEFNNDFFSFLGEHLPENFTKIYSATKQEFNQENKGGQVQLDFLDATLEEHRDHALEMIHGHIKESVNDGYELGDIAIITRFNREGTDIAEFLHAKGIHVSSSDSLVLPSSPEVRFLISNIRFLEDPSSSVAKAEMIDYIYKGDQKQEAIRTYSSSPSPVFLKWMESEGFEFNPENLRLKSLYETIEELIRIYRIDDHDPYVLSLLDQVLQFSMKQNKSHGVFLQWWDDNCHKLSIDGSGEQNAIRIMSIHKAKGLEFPVVICPFMNWTQGPQRDDIWTNSRNDEVPGLPVFLLPAEKKLGETIYSDLYTAENEKSLLDDLNIVYVGFTRPSERLYVISSFPHRYGNLSSHFLAYLDHKGIKEEGKSTYLFGEKHKAKPKKKVEKQQVVIGSYPKGPWNEVVEISRESLRLIDDERVLKKTYGKLVHQVLSEINSRSEIKIKLQNLYEDGMISEENMLELGERIERILGNSKLEALFADGKKIKSETDILLPEGRFIRPDRVVIEKDLVTIIDYKTGKKTDKDREQVEGYAQILGEMGYGNIRKLLVYIGEEEVVEL